MYFYPLSARSADRGFFVILNDSEESHRKSAEVYTLSVKSWDISLTLNMTYFFLRHPERSEGSHRRTAGHILFTLVVGYFADAQYDVRSPIGGVAATSPEGGSEFCFIVFASAAKQTPGRVGFHKAYTISLKSWDISLALDMTRQKLFFLFIVFVGFAVDDIFICRHEFVRKI